MDARALQRALASSASRCLTACCPAAIPAAWWTWRPTRRPGMPMPGIRPRTCARARPPGSARGARSAWCRTPRPPGTLYDEFAYRDADYEAGPPAPPALPAPTGADALPAGWHALPRAFPAWSIARRVQRVTAAQALAGPDAGASPKPTWDALVEAERAARLGSLPAALVRRANAEAKARIAIAYAGTPDRIEEITRRLNGRATAAQDAERARLVAVCHALERRIGEAQTVEALEAIDVTSEAAWAALDDGGNDGEEEE